jgi:hypothetical protein
MPETFIITSPDGSVAEASVFADEAALIAGAVDFIAASAAEAIAARAVTSAALTTSADPLQAPRSRQPLVCSRSNKLVVFARIDNTGRLRPPRRCVRSVGDLQIPIGPAQPNRAPSSPRFPPYEAFERRPPSSPARLQRPASETLQRSSRPLRGLRTARSALLVPALAYSIASNVSKLARRAASADGFAL